MPERDDRSLDEVHQSEENPYNDRQNLEPEPSAQDAERVTVRRDPDVVSGDAESDISEYARPDTADQQAKREAPRTHDDDDPWGDGISDTPLVSRYEDMADRDELARRLEDLVADAYDWAARSEEDDAQEIYDVLLSVSERLGNPPEETTRTEQGAPPPDRDEVDM